MKSGISKSIIAGVAVLVMFGLSTGKANASAPDVAGKVLNKNDNRVIAGVWVKWVDGRGSIRYARTDANGEFKFISWQTMGSGITNECQTMIDSDNDGTNDVKMASDSTGSSCPQNAFGCGENPHRWSVVKPKGWVGDFENVREVNFVERDLVNAQFRLDIGAFYWITAMEPGCDCDNLTYEGEFLPGKSLSFISSWRVNDPYNNPGQVREIKFKMSDSVSQISEESIVPAPPVRQDNSDFYRGTYNYQIPVYYSADQIFTLNISSVCVDRNQAYVIRQKIDKSVFLSRLLDSLRIRPVYAQPGIPLTGYPSLQLGTFLPTHVVEKTCTSLKYIIQYSSN